MLGERREQLISQGAGVRPKVVDFSKLEISKLPMFKGRKALSLQFLDVDCDRWKPLYIAKLRSCYKQADFSDTKKDLEFKEHKKEAMIDLIDILEDGNAAQYLFND